MKWRVARILFPVLLLFFSFLFFAVPGHAQSTGSFTFQACAPDGTTCTSSSNKQTITVQYGQSVTLKWSGSNITWCWGYRWATLQKDSDGSGWVQPPDQSTPAPPNTITTQTKTIDNLQSTKSFSLDCGQPGSPAALQTVNVNVGAQNVSISGFTPGYGAPPVTSGPAINQTPGVAVVVSGTAFYVQDSKEISWVRFCTSPTAASGTCKGAKNLSVDGTTQLTATPAAGTANNSYICIKTTPPKSTAQTVCSTQQFKIAPSPTFTFQACKADGSGVCSAVGVSGSINVNNGDSVFLKWNTNNGTWCWGTGWSTATPGSDGWVQPPNYTDLNNPPTTPFGSQTQPFALTFSSTFSLACGAPNNPDPTQTVTVNVAGPPPGASAGGLPYIKVSGGDVFTGGAFFNGSGDCSNQDLSYQSPAGTYQGTDGSGNPITITKKPQIGGIITYGLPPSNGASTNQGVFASGGVVNDAASRYGFMSGIGDNSLTFSNTKPGYWGGFLDGGTRQSHCIPDYYGTKRDLPKAWTNKLKNLPSGQYFVDATGTPVEIPASTIDTTQNITLFVNGDAWISGDITYNSDQETIDDIPKLAIVVSGNLYIDSAVKQLDGFYVAQPAGGDNCDDFTNLETCHGRIFTCHDSTPDVVPGMDYLSKQCRKPLTINGALVAADVEFDRTFGDMSGFDPTHMPNQPAETINFIPEMILGGSFFHGPSAATSNQSKIDSIISLPPVF